MNKGRLYLLVAILMLVVLGVSQTSAMSSPRDRERRVAPHVATIVSPLLQYQGRLTDPGTGEAVADGAYGMTFSLYDVDIGGTALWTETKDVTVQRGIFSTALGDTTALDTGVFNGQALWLGIAVEGDPEATPRQQFLPVAYALSLVPGAQVVGQEDNTAALTVSHTGDGNGLRSVISSTNASRAAIYADNQGAGFGVAGVAGGTDAAGVVGYNSAEGAGVLGESNDGYGVYGLSWGEGAGVKGVSHYIYTPTGVLGYGVLGTSEYGIGGCFTSTTAYGVLGTSEYGIGGYFTSTTAYGLLAETAARGSMQAALVGQVGTGISNLNRESGVLGKASDGFGVAGVSTNYYGVIGFSNNSYAVRAENLGDLPALYARNYGSSGAPAIYAGGGMTVTGDLQVGGDVLGKNGTGLPVAYGYVNADGSLASGTSNLTTAWDATRYEITIAGHSYFYNQYVTQVTLSSSCSYQNSVRTSSVSGNLLVYVYDSISTTVQCAFQFVTYKP